MSEELRKLPIYIGVFLISSATLILEISLTRFFSVAKWYHFAFMVVSIALFGLGAGGSSLTLFPSLLGRSLNKLLFTFSGLFSLSCLFSLVVANQIPFDPFRFAWDSMQILFLLFYYLVLAVPFLFSGLCTATILSKMGGNAGKIYFSDLIGAGLGSLLAILSPLSGSRIIFFASLLGAASTLSFSLHLPRKCSYMSLFLVIALIISLPCAQSLLQIEISPYKSLKAALRYPDAELLFTQWNAFSRVDVVKSPYVRYAPGLSYEYRRDLPPQLGITVDGNGLNAITHYEGDLNAIEFTDFLPMALVYHLKEDQSALILGSGGGLSVLTALYNDVQSIIAVEINPIIVDLVKGRYGEFSGDIYGDERVRVEVMDSRGFIRSCNEEFDVIQLPLTENVAASSTGIYALSENYIYTKEAFEDFYTHLTENGFLSITRWLLPPPREEIRIVSLAVSALEGQGIHDLEGRIAVIRSWCTITLLIKKGEFTSEEVCGVKEFCRVRKFDLVHVPGITLSEVNLYNKFPEPYYYNMIRNLLSVESRAQLYDSYLFDVTPVSDERPFFFQFFKWEKIVPIYESMGEKWQPFIEGGYLAPVVFAEALMLSLLFILLPVRLSKKMRKAHVKWSVLGYFLSLGFAYMFIEMVLIQKFILFLGHPVYSVSIVLFTILSSSGVGSLFSQRLKIREGRALALVIPILSGAVALYLIALPNLFKLLLGQKLFIRILTSPILIGPLGFIMGMPFPLGIRRVNKLNPDLIPWVCSINGCSSVLGSILPVTIALSLGFPSVLALGGVVYLAGLMMILHLRRG
jgi:hypothetical protein